MTTRPALACILALGLPIAAGTACSSGPAPDAGPPSSEVGTPVEATSLLGRPLPAPDLPADFRAAQEALLAEARADLAARPDDPEALIWVGRRTAYLGRYREAVEVYSRGIEAHPDDPRLYRHRGHRFITLRRLADAVADLERATALIAGTPDEVEPDGLPNARNLPTSTLHSNIWYHLGLARYLQGDLPRALDAYRACLDVSRNPDMLSATSHWLYMTLRRLGRGDEAEPVLDPIHRDLDVIENQDYHRLLLMYRGEIPPQELLAQAEARGALSFVTTGYGVGNWYLVEGEPDRAAALFRRIVATDSWASFGFIAAEAELARMGGDQAAAER